MGKSSLAGLVNYCHGLKGMGAAAVPFCLAISVWQAYADDL